MFGLRLQVMRRQVKTASYYQADLYGVATIRPTDYVRPNLAFISFLARQPPVGQGLLIF
jgi:hypothetical protein